MITVKELEQKGLIGPAIELHSFLIYNPKYEGRIVGYEERPYDIIFFIDDGSKVKFDVHNSTSVFYEPGFKQEDRTKEEINKDIARNIIKIMHHTPYNQTDLAEICGVSQKTISNYLTCSHGSMPVWMLAKIAKLLGVSINDLYEK